MIPKASENVSQKMQRSRNITKTQCVLNIGKRHQFRNYISNISQSIMGQIPGGYRHIHWVAKRHQSGSAQISLVWRLQCGPHERQKARIPSLDATATIVHPMRILWSHEKWTFLPSLHSPPLQRSSNRMKTSNSGLDMMSDRYHSTSCRQCTCNTKPVMTRLL